MYKEAMKEIINWIKLYYEDTFFWVLTGIALIYLFFADKKVRGPIIYPVLFVFFCILNPILYHHIFSKIIYWRFFWILPETLIIGYAFVLFLKKIKKDLVKLFIIIGFVVCICIGGNNVYDNPEYVKAQNEQKVAAATQEVCDYMLSVDENPTCIAPNELVWEMRQYSGEVELMYGRNVDGYILTPDDVSMRMSEELSSNNPDYHYIFGMALNRKYEFVVADAAKVVDSEILATYGYKMLAEKSGYGIYYHENIQSSNIGGWVITQYGSGTSTNSCYTIEDEDNNLIIIDGGYGWYEEKLRAVIRAHDNHVTAWIVTSPRAGCSGAFCSIIKNPKDITVDTVYSFEVTQEQREQYLNDANEGQDTDASIEMLETVDNLDNVVYVKEDDVFHVLGLEFDVLHTWDEEVDALNQYQEYNGALCFVVSGKEESMLFLSSLTNPMEQYILDRHSEEIDTEYVQVNNNGEWYFSGEFYDLVSPNVAFIDWRSVDDNPGETVGNVWDVYNYMQWRGVFVYTYNTSCNWIILR